MQFCNKFTYYFVYIYAIIIFLFSSDTLHVLMFVCPSISELRFCGCCHPCSVIILLHTPCQGFPPPPKPEIYPDLTEASAPNETRMQTIICLLYAFDCVLFLPIQNLPTQKAVEGGIFPPPPQNVPSNLFERGKQPFTYPLPPTQRKTGCL